MKSSACKFVLDKVSKFEKKYSKPLLKQRSKEELTLKDDENSVFSESLNDQIRESRSMLNANNNEIKDALSKFKTPFNFSNSDNSKPTIHSRSFQKISEGSGVAKLTLMPKNNMKINSAENKRKRINVLGKLDSNSSSDNDNHLSLIEETKQNTTLKGRNKLITKEFYKDLETLNDENLLNPVVTEDKKIVNYKQKMPITTEETNKEDVERNRLRMSLNLKLYDDPDKVSDKSSKDIDSLSLENSSISENLPFRILTIEDLVAEEESKTEEKELKEKKISNSDSENIPLRIFAFEDLIASEELKSINEESMNELEAKGNSNKHSHETVNRSNSQQKKYSQQSGSECEEKNNEKTSEEDNIEEILTSEKYSVESSIKEDIPEIEKSINENTNDLSDQLHSSLEEIVHSKNVHTNKKKSENHFTSVQLNDSLSSKQGSSNLLREKVPSISFEKKDVKQINQTVKCMNKQLTNLYKSQETNFSEKGKQSDKNLKSIQDQKHKITLKDSQKTKCTEKEHNKREEKLKNKSTLMDNNELISKMGLQCHASTQTHNLRLLETYDFEKRMDAIMKTSFNSMTDMTNLQLEMNNIFTDHNCQAGTSTGCSWSPLEKGFHCALKQQIELTKHFVRAEYNMYAVCMTAIKEMSASYKPATLHNYKKTKNKQSYK